MKTIQFFLRIILGFVFFFVKRMKIKNNRITFITIESDELRDDLKMIYEKLDREKYDIKVDAFQYSKKSLMNNIQYLFQCIKQVYDVNTSRIVLLRDNNYVVSNFKRDDVKVIQVWHASGAIKKFGNATERKYAISNYDYVIANSNYWKEPYAYAFSVEQENVLNLGMPRIDQLHDKEFLAKVRENLREELSVSEKKVILYAPTFRGDIYSGFRMIPFDLEKVVESLGEEYVILCKYHPLLSDYFPYQHHQIINCNKYSTYDLFAASDMMISDYSSIIFDYALLNRPMLYFVPDLEEYCADRGLFVEYYGLPGKVCVSEDDVIEAVRNPKMEGISEFAQKFFTYQDGKNTERNVEFIGKLIEKSCNA